MTYFDIAIIGGGPAGYTAAGKIASNGLKTVLFEKNAIGGICLNEGCIPSKTLLYSAKTLDSVKNASKYGIKVSEGASADLDKIIARKKKVIRKLAGGVRMQLTGLGVEMINGEAVILGEDSDCIHVSCNNEEYCVKKILLCTGSETTIPPIKGLTNIDYWTSREALNANEVPQSLVIIGGGNIGLEFASFFNSMGSKVTVVEMMPEILPQMDKEISSMLRTEYEKKDVVFHVETKVTEVTPDFVIIEKNGESIKLDYDKLMICVGRKPNLSGIGIENLNLEVDSNGLKVNKYMQTNHPNVYACGDITGYSMLAHTAMREANVAVDHILGSSDKMSYKTIPFVTYTNPELAAVGKTEEELITTGTEYKVLKMPMAFSGRFVAENEMSNGLCKIIVDKNNKIIGCHMLGNPVSELIVIAGIAIEKEFTVEEFRKVIFAHPTVGEIFHETLNSK